MKQKIVITYPASKAEDDGYVHAASALSELCGGCTVAGPMTGVWIAPDGEAVREDVGAVSFCVPFHVGYSTIEDAVQAIVQALFRTGEQAVLVEYYRPGGYTFNIYEREKGHEQSV